MTCLAWDGRYLVADGRSTLGDLIADDDVRKLRHINHPDHGPMVAGLCGQNRYFEKWLEAIEVGGFSAYLGSTESDVVGGFFVDRGGRCWEVDGDGTWIQVTSFSASGSGAVLAYPILRDGGSALDAVRFACRHSTSCGGTIRVYCPRSHVIVALKD
jgi:20S proteasome alpha/beta subunit